MPRFKVGDIISWNNYPSLTISEVNKTGNYTTYKFSDGMSQGTQTIDLGINNIAPAEKIGELTLGGRTRRKRRKLIRRKRCSQRWRRCRKV